MKRYIKSSQSTSTPLDDWYNTEDAQYQYWDFLDSLEKSLFEKYPNYNRHFSDSGGTMQSGDLVFTYSKDDNHFYELRYNYRQVQSDICEKGWKAASGFYFNKIDNAIRNNKGTEIA